MGDTSNIELPPLKTAWVTLLTRTSYLPGAVLLAYSLHKNTSKYPLIILTTPSFPSELLSTLSSECTLTNTYILPIQSLSPPPENKPALLIASRFADTWTKLRVFELYKYGFERMIFLDADMLIRRNMDELFDIELPGKNWIAANHACVCNLDGDSWAPKDWTKENCAYTGLKWNDPPTLVPKNGPKALLNSGMFYFQPYEAQWKDMLDFLKEDARVKHYMFPDQDFLADFFKGRWMSVGWQYNALKTMRYWHGHMWKDQEVRNLHYIVDKPWGKRIGARGIAGYLGKDGVTHQWWWIEYRKWEKERETGQKYKILEMMHMEVAITLIGNGEAESFY